MPFKKSLWGAVCAVLAAAPPALADEFAFKYAPGDKFHIVSKVSEEYSRNGAAAGGAVIHNRIGTEVTGVADGKARHKALFQVMVSKKGADGGESLGITNEYTSVYERDAYGNMSVGRDYAFPSVRNVPVFPARDLRVGDTWSGAGEEVHDMRGNFGLSGLLRLPFNARYAYLGERDWEGKKYPAFLITYTIARRFGDYLERSPRTYLSRPAREDAETALTITSVSGETRQTIFWDAARGQPAASQGSFALRFTMSDGTTHDFRSTEEARVIYAPDMDKDGILADVEKDLRDSGVAGATVKKVADGVSISVENIQFESDSAVLRPGERQKLDKIAGILAKYGERDILVAGHTAAAGGTPESHERLSRERAAAVAGYLALKKARPPERIMTKGYGADAPVADNGTEEGRRKNRRVEIVILEN